MSSSVSLSSPIYTGAIEMARDVWCRRSSGSIPQTVVPSSTRPGRTRAPAETSIASSNVVFPTPLRPSRATVRALGWRVAMTPRFVESLRLNVVPTSRSCRKYALTRCRHLLGAHLRRRGPSDVMLPLERARLLTVARVEHWFPRWPSLERSPSASALAGRQFRVREESLYRCGVLARPAPPATIRP